MPRKYVAVCGASDATASQLASAREVGRLLAEAGVVVINGGVGGGWGGAGGGGAGGGGAGGGGPSGTGAAGAQPKIPSPLPARPGPARPHFFLPPGGKRL